ncbi:M48 family metalloprotease [Streptomyces violaceusniger]|uniref:Peptidase M48 Ste24p n=1 Tax=Streptomyces violaceusniger (strain Tu 4113) TaxID=653045 RepID=G2P183_STRV4|nr:M48 family metalloprotease [Streptomyces violaceusniger]AEM88148.1 peptidase M48 Ste24p [Streptomyces violaceusniger Tu 4113]
MIAAARALLALALLAVFYALVAAMVLLWGAFLAAALWTAAEPGVQTPPMSVVTACAAFAPIVFGMVWAVIRTARPAVSREDAVPVTRRGAPELWRTVEELALAVGTRPPARIRLTAEVNASVTEDAPLLGLAPGRRVLYLGMPLLACLSSAELRAVLAHELGHFSRRHSRFGAVAHRGAAGLVAARQAIQDASAANDLVRLYAGWPLLLLGLYTHVFRWLTRPVRRRQELEADREAARVAGPGAMADALRSTAALEAAWQEFLADFLAPMRRATGRIPDDPFRAFAHMVEAPEVREPLAALRARAVERPADPDDAHPALATRLERLARLPAPEPGAEPLFPGSLSPDPLAPDPLSLRSRYAVAMGRVMLSGPDAGKRVPWRDWLTELAEHRATRILTPLAEAVRGVEAAEGMGRQKAGPNAEPVAEPDARWVGEPEAGPNAEPVAEPDARWAGEPEAGPVVEPAAQPDALTIQRVLRLLESGRRMPLARALNSRLYSRLSNGERTPHPEQTEGDDPLSSLADALAVLIGAQLVAQGTAYWAMNWTGPSILVPPDGIAPETIRTWADTAVRLPGQTQRLGLHLAALGVDERAPLPGPAGGTAAGPVPGEKARRISIAPEVTGPARRRIIGVGALALTVLVGMTGLTFALWANKDEPSYPRIPVTRWNDRYQPGGGTGTDPAPYPTYQRPTFPDRPTVPTYQIPLPPPIHIDPVIPRPAP